MAPKSRLDSEIENAQQVRDRASIALEIADSVLQSLLRVRSNSGITTEPKAKRGSKPKGLPKEELS